jgi:hypothetical protein
VFGGYRVKSRRKQVAELRGEMIRLYKILLNAKEVGRRLGVAAGSVKFALEQAGIPMRGVRGLSDEERFDHYVSSEPNTGCWLWLGGEARNGYSLFHVRQPDGSFKRSIAHRWSYEHFIGPIPEGLELDHKCRNRWCVNPEHLEPVTHYENQRRAPNSLMNRVLRGEKMGVHAKRSIKKALDRQNTFAEHRGSEEE